MYTVRGTAERGQKKNGTPRKMLRELLKNTTLI